MKILKVYLAFLWVLTLYFLFLAPRVVYGSFEPKSSNLEALQPQISASTKLTTEQCNLSFYSYKSFKEVDTPSRFFDNLTEQYNCEDLLLLSKIAHYESEWGLYMQNESNEYAQGAFMILPTTRGECLNKWGIEEEDQCALYVIKNYPEWYLLGYESAGFNLSFI